MNNTIIEQTKTGGLIQTAKELSILNNILITRFHIVVLAVDDAPNSYKELRKRIISDNGLDEQTTFKNCGNVFISVSKDGCQNTIYDNVQDNYNFRALHDYFHFVNGYNFSNKGEINTFKAHAIALKKLGASDKVIELLKIDVVGQIQYYEQNKQFVKNQRNFVQSSLMTSKKAGKFCIAQGVF